MIGPVRLNKIDAETDSNGRLIIPVLARQPILRVALSRSLFLARFRRPRVRTDRSNFGGKQLRASMDCRCSRCSHHRCASRSSVAFIFFLLSVSLSSLSLLPYRYYPGHQAYSARYFRV